MPATWFTREEKSSKEFVLHPLSEMDSWQVELLYQNAVRASSSLGDGIEDILKEEVVLESDPNFKVMLCKNGGVLSLKKRQKTSGFFSLGGPQFTLQRGYGAYTVEGTKMMKGSTDESRFRTTITLSQFTSIDLDFTLKAKTMITR